MNIATLLQMTADAFGDRIAISDGTTKLSYADWYSAAERAADYFQKSGCKYVAALDVYTPALPVALYGAAMAGIPYVPLNYRLTNPEIDALLERIPSFCLITSADRVAKYSEGRSNVVIESETFLNNMRSAAAPSGDINSRIAETDPAQVAVQLFTSGTTGTPKAAVLRHKNIVSYVLGSVEFASAGEDDAVLVSVPPYHIAGISAVISAVFASRRVVLLPSFDAATWLELARKENVTNAFIVPTMLVRIVDHLESTGAAPELPALRAIAYGGGKMPETVIRRALELFPNVDFTNAYGLTETSSTITVLGPAEHRAALQSDRPEVVRRLTSVGVALPGVEIQIRDAEGNVQPPNQPGEIYVRGEQVSGEYVGKGSLLDAEGWFPTRDAGSFDEEGYLFLEGRADDVIVRGGENISPGEIEDVLMTHAAVLDAAVVGIPSEQWGEAVAAAVQLKTNASVTVLELQELVRQRLRSWRIPEHISFLESLPYNETGKLLRRTVKQQLTAVVVK